MGHALLQEKVPLGAKFLDRPQSARERAARRWFAKEKPPVGTMGASGEVFPGQYFDSETNLHYNMQRYYSTDVGRYITSDPIGLNGGFNTYGYVGQNPVVRSDPSGLFFPLVIPAIPPALAALGEAAAYLGSAALAGYALSELVDAFDSDDAKEEAEEREETCPPDDDDFCWERYQTELATCRGLGVAERAGRVPKGSASRCYESAERRYWACMNNQPEPPFHGWPQY